MSNLTVRIKPTDRSEERNKMPATVVHVSECWRMIQIKNCFKLVFPEKQIKTEPTLQQFYSRFLTILKHHKHSSILNMLQYRLRIQVYLMPLYQLQWLFNTKLHYYERLNGKDMTGSSRESRQPTAYCLLPTAYSLQPTAYCL